MPIFLQAMEQNRGGFPFSRHARLGVPHTSQIKSYIGIIKTYSRAELMYSSLI